MSVEVKMKKKYRNAPALRRGSPSRLSILLPTRSAQNGVLFCEPLTQWPTGELRNTIRNNVITVSVMYKETLGDVCDRSYETVKRWYYLRSIDVLELIMFSL